ncbi:hypothetical protein NDU88_005673 [Pleurodeles waltl]|uniref:Uncharacterized protein n=1 Tax=Pleurodeles waltl TaxID=8319 RepID=A0AAV7MDM7_PLEWA|nr:hypothetical protein NDU88_005673 [Pleurodeles waltl]
MPRCDPWRPGRRLQVVSPGSRRTRAGRWGGCLGRTGCGRDPQIGPNVCLKQNPLDLAESPSCADLSGSRRGVRSLQGSPGSLAEDDALGGPGNDEAL